MFRSKFTLVILTLTALLIFAACGSASQSTTSEADDVAATEASAEAPAEIVAEEAPAENADESGEESVAEAGETVTYAVDTAASTLAWYGSKPIGASESGTVAISEGQLRINGAEFVDGTFVIDMHSIETTTQSGNMKNMLEDHLKSDDFFGVETYPTAMLDIKSVEPTDVENQYRVIADLTLKETTDEVEFITAVTVIENGLEATADIVIDRAVYDVRYNSGSFFSGLGDDLISDEMELTVNLVARS